MAPLLGGCVGQGTPPPPLLLPALPTPPAARRELEHQALGKGKKMGGRMGDLASFTANRERRMERS